MGHPLIVLENCYLNYLSSILNLLHGIIGNKPTLQKSIPTRSMYCFVLPDLSTLSLLIGPLQVIYHLLTRTILDNPRSSGAFSLHAHESDIDWRMSACWSLHFYILLELAAVFLITLLFIRAIIDTEWQIVASCLSQTDAMTPLCVLACILNLMFFLNKPYVL